MTRRLRPVVLLCLIAVFFLISFISQPTYPSRAIVPQMAVATSLPSCSSFSPCGNNIYAIADAYTDRTYPDTNFGGQTVLYVSSDARLTSVYESFLKFNLGTIPAGKTFVGATLYLCGKSLSGSTVTVYLYDSTFTGWQESTITWSNRPPMGTQIATGTIAVGSQAEQGYYCSSWNVSNYVFQKLWARTPIITLGLRSGYGSLYYLSREYPYTIPAQGHAVGNPVIQTMWR